MLFLLFSILSNLSGIPIEEKNLIVTRKQRKKEKNIEKHNTNTSFEKSCDNNGKEGLASNMNENSAASKTKTSKLDNLTQNTRNQSKEPNKDLKTKLLLFVYKKRINLIPMKVKCSVRMLFRRRKVVLALI